MRTLIEAAVMAKLANNEGFTAHDITKEVRKLTTDNVDHTDVRDTVKELFRLGIMSGYKTELGSFPGVTTQPLVYTPSNKSSCFYGQLNCNSLTGGVCICGLPGSSPDEVVKGLDSSNRLLIPNDLVKAIGLLPGQSASVTVTSGSIFNEATLKLSAKYDTGAFKNYQVDQSNNVRVCKNCLNELDPSATSFKINLVGSEIIISTT